MTSDRASEMRRLAWAEAEVSVDPDVRGGLPVLRGTRIGDYEIANLAEHTTMREILEDYPSLTSDRIDAARLYARVHPRAGRPRMLRSTPSNARKVASSKIDVDTI